MLHNYWKFPNRNVQTFGSVYHDTKWPKSGPAWKTQSFFLSGIFTVLFWQDYCGKGNLRKSYCSTVGRRFTKWTKACDKRLNPLISYIHHTCEYKQYCFVGNTAKQRRLGLFQDSDFAGDLEDSKSTSGGTLCVSGSHTFVPISWLCKKQTSVSHSSTESESISLDAGLRLDVFLALDLWDLIVSVFGNTTQNHDRTGQPVVNWQESKISKEN